MSNNPRLYSQALNLLRFPLAIIIVTDHTFLNSHIVGGVIDQLDNYSILFVVRSFIQSFFLGQSVPIYFFIAGYVFFLNIEFTRGTYCRKMCNRFKSLLVPYILWNMLAIVVALLSHCIQVYMGEDVGEIDLSFNSIARCFWNYDGSIIGKPREAVGYPIDGPLWFVRGLILIAVFTPLINWCYKYTGCLLPLVSGIAWFFDADLGSPMFASVITSLFFFSWGGYISFKQKDIVKEFARIRIPSALCYIVSGLILLGINLSYPLPDVIIDRAVYIKNFTIFMGLFCAFNISVSLIEKCNFKPRELLSKASFFVYAAHSIVLGYVFRAFVLVLPPVSEFNVMAAFTLTDIALCVGLTGLYIWMHRYMPGILRLFTGGRL